MRPGIIKYLEIVAVVMTGNWSQVSLFLLSSSVHKSVYYPVSKIQLLYFS